MTDRNISDDKDPIEFRFFEAYNRHMKKILMAEFVVIGAFVLKPKVAAEIAKYRQLQKHADEAKMILMEMSYTMDEMARTLVEVAEK